jgi:uncharacterized protein (TIGR03437 family)
MNMRLTCLLSAAWISFFAHSAIGQTRTIGLIANDATRTSPGYTLLAPKHYGRTYLIDNDGQVINTWDSQYEPGQSAYLLENGHLLRAAMLPSSGALGTGGGEGGRIEEYDWEGNLVWEFDYSSSTYSIHHDIKMLPNGNVIALLVERKSQTEVLAAGFKPDLLQDNFLLPDAVVEIAPTRPKGGRIVWEWHVWDHLIQNYDRSKSNYGDSGAHPELVDPNASPRKLATFWNHMNSIDYNPVFDQILLSVRGSSEVWVIDHSTTTAQASSHAGGKSGKGGDLLYRWGNPQTYYAGKSADQVLFEQHDAQWIEAGRTGAGNMIVFNNGVNRTGGNYSSADEFTVPVDSSGNYSLTAGSAYAPAKLNWTYAGLKGSQWYETDISGAYRLPNGNTLLCYGTHGVLVEVTGSGEIVWQYVNPVSRTGPMYQGETSGLDDRGHNLNAVFRARRYPPAYAGLSGRSLAPKGAIELTGTRFVNGASFGSGPAAAGAVLTAFSDTTLSDGEAAATTETLPVKLAGTSVEIKDSAGATQSCGLYYVSTRQINLVLPDRVARGEATLTIRRDSGASVSGAITIEAAAPGLFTMGTSGIGAILGLRVDASGQRSDLTAFRYDQAKAQFLTTPIDLGAASDQVYLSLYGTGIRGFSSTAAISATIADIAVPVTGAAAHSRYAGMDQVNIGPLPRSLAGKGAANLALTVDGKTANAVGLNIR